MTLLDTDAKPSRTLRSCMVVTAELAGAMRLVKVLKGWGYSETKPVPLRASLPSALASQRPDVLVFSYHSPTFEAVAAHMKTTGHQPICIVVSERPIKTLGALQGTPQLCAIGGSGRLLPRMLEAVTAALGRAPRVTPGQSPLRAEIAEESGRVHQVTLLNLSESGAKVTSWRGLEVGMPVMLRFSLLGQSYEEEIVPMRRMPEADGREIAGVQFEAISPDLVRVISKLLGSGNSSDSGRGSRRQVAPAALRPKVRLTVEGLTPVHYLALQDLSLTGLAAVLPPTATTTLTPGQRVQLRVSWNGKSVTAAASLVRAHEPKSRLLAFRFSKLDRKATLDLKSLLIAMVKQPGRRRAPDQTQSARRFSSRTI